MNPEDITETEYDDIIQRVWKDPESGQEFDITETQVTLPLKTSGSASTLGWDIATEYAIDGAGKIWMTNGHGGCLEPSDLHNLIYCLKDSMSPYYIAEFCKSYDIPLREVCCSTCGGKGKILEPDVR